MLLLKISLLLKIVICIIRMVPTKIFNFLAHIVPHFQKHDSALWTCRHAPRGAFLSPSTRETFGSAEKSSRMPCTLLITPNRVHTYQPFVTFSPLIANRRYLSSLSLVLDSRWFAYLQLIYCLKRTLLTVCSAYRWHFDVVNDMGSVLSGNFSWTRHGYNIVS